MRVARSGLPRPLAGRPLVVCANHAAWWDPLLFILLSVRLFPDRACFGVMDAAMLERYGVFKRLGVLGVSPDARGAARLIRTGGALLADPACALFLTPQGRFADVRDRPVRLRPGLAHLLVRAPGAVALPLAVEYVFWNESKPEALVRFGPPVDAAGLDPKAANAALEEALTGAMDRLAAESRSRDPDLFLAVQRSRVGVGGVYDLWRRGRAWSRGRRFDPSHEGRG